MSLSLYTNEKTILDAALAAGGGHIDLTTPGKAVQLRQRLYTFRKLYREAYPNTPYDCLTIPKLAQGRTRVEIKVKEIEGVFVPKTGGKPVKAPNIEIAADDPLLLEALNIAGDILGDD